MLSLVGFFFIGAFLGAKNMTKENASIIDNCIKTEMYVIGNKGYATPVYDCSNKKD